MSTENERSGGPAADANNIDPAADDSADAQADKLEEKVEAAREDLGDLVGELDRRRHRAMKPLAIGAIAVTVVGVGAYVAWRLLRSRPSRMQRVRQALQRTMARPESMAEGKPDAVKKALGATVSAAIASAGLRVAERWSSAGSS